MNLTRKDIAIVMECVLSDRSVRRATKFVSSDFIVRAVRQFKGSARDTRTTILFTFGKPCFLEREFIRSCRKAKEPFPVKNVQLKFYQ